MKNILQTLYPWKLPHKQEYGLKRIVRIMKATVILLMIAIFHIHAASMYSQMAKVNLSATRLSIEKLILTVEDQTNFLFLYSEKEIDLNQEVRIRTKDSPVNEILAQAFASTDITYTIHEDYISLRRKSLPDSQTFPQAGRRITGVVADASGEPIIGANVIEKGTTNGVITDTDGTFSLQADDNSMLQISYIGYITREIPVAAQPGTIFVTLLEDSRALTEVVVVAYGTQNKRNVTGSMETVKFENLTDMPVGQFAQKLQGQITGGQVNQGTGKPGQGMNIRIRGSGSISSTSAPLYVVDGFPIVGDISNINPGEIESLTVLKDAAATSIYGSRAAFGVILITTKSAKSGETRVNVNAYTGIQQVPQRGRPDMMNGTEWAQFRKEHYEDMGVEVPEAFRNPSQYGKGYNWYDAMLRTAQISDYSVSVNAGKDNFSSSVVLGYFRQEGVVINSAYDRFSARANNEYTFSDKFKVAVNIAPSFSYDNAPPADGFFGGGGGLLDNARLTPPVISWKNADGTMPAAVTTPGITAFSTPNWIRSAQDIVNKSQWSRLLSNGYLEYEPIRNLKLKTSISVDLGNSNTHYFQSSTASRGFATTPSSINAYLSDASFRYYSWLNENTVSYMKQAGEHELDVLLGYTTQKYRSDYSFMSGSNFSDDRIETINMALVKNNPEMDIQQWSMISYLGRVNYSYKDRYLLSASFRRDGSSRFGINNKWGSFPSVSAGWIASDEDFMSRLDKRLFLKLRASYGIIGNNNIGNYTQYNRVSDSNAVFGNTSYSGSAVTNLGNDDLGWEMTRQLDLGIDLGFFNNRVNFTYDYYRKITTDLLYQLPIPQESGFSSFMGNMGKIKFWGNEFTLNTKNLTGNFKWDTNFNIAFSDNRVLALSDISDQLVAYSSRVSTITRVGGRIGQFYGPVQVGVYTDQADFDNSPKLVNSEVGTIKFKDINRDGEITLVDVDGDKTEIGNPLPKFIFGFINNFSYRHFDLSVVMSGSYGNKVMATEEGITNLDGVFNVLKDVKDRWRSPENPGAGKYGKSTGATEADRNPHSRCVYDGSHLTIKNVTLGYNIPCKLVKNIESIRVFGSIQQLYVFTKYPYGNPEAGVDADGNSPSPLLQGIDNSTYPVPRTFTLGISFTIQ
ncbi:MAG: TonB-dependent receptor [Tannerellaceae bacterium]|jgi:TonB-linked SusC/RagA family outer membrane protein|nr:TonB-dependent receptor [Tannerellaceae bacterium]